MKLGCCSTDIELDPHFASLISNNFFKTKLALLNNFDNEILFVLCGLAPLL